MIVVGLEAGNMWGDGLPPRRCEESFPSSVVAFGVAALFSVVMRIVLM